MIKEITDKDLIRGLISFDEMYKEIGIADPLRFNPYINKNNRWFICLDEKNIPQGHIRAQILSDELILIHGGLFRRQRGKDINKSFIQELMRLLKKEYTSATVLAITSSPAARALAIKAGLTQIGQCNDQYILGVCN